LETGEESVEKCTDWIFGTCKGNRSEEEMETVHFRNPTVYDMARNGDGMSG